VILWLSLSGFFSRSLKVQMVRDSEGKDVRRLPPPKLWLRFRSLPTCQAFNPSATKVSNVELAVGFQNGSTFVFCPFEVKDTKPVSIVGLMFNAGYPAAVNAVKWHPSSKHIFASAHDDGCLMIFDKSKRFPNPSGLNLGENDPTKRQPKNPKNPDVSADPILRWKVSSSAIVDFEFSTDGSLAATVHRDGRVFILHMESNDRIASFKSYFGGLFSISWSPDDKFIVVGGEDDLISIWNVQEKSLVARGYGHRSWVSRVSFHPIVANKEYRLMSVGHDGRVAVWRFKDPDASMFKSEEEKKSSPVPYEKLHPEGVFPIHEEPIRGFALSFFLMISLCSENHLKVWSWEPNKSPDEKSLFPEE
jgi:WD40 repeat protein